MMPVRLQIAVGDVFAACAPRPWSGCQAAFTSTVPQMIRELRRGDLSYILPISLSFKRRLLYSVELKIHDFAPHHVAQVVFPKTPEPPGAIDQELEA